MTGEVFTPEFKVEPIPPPMTQREEHIADALYLVRVERDRYCTALQDIADGGVWGRDAVARANRALKWGETDA